jgi:hypothetical protein
MLEEYENEKEYKKMNIHDAKDMLSIKPWIF